MYKRGEFGILSLLWFNQIFCEKFDVPYPVTKLTGDSLKSEQSLKELSEVNVANSLIYWFLLHYFFDSMSMSL